MTTPTKTTVDTRTQLRNLMSQHTAATYAKPSVPVAARDNAPIVAKAMTPATPTLPSKPVVASERYTVRLLPGEIEKVDALTLEAHQRLGERITVSDVLRIGLTRIGTNAPITADELAGLRSRDRRRHQAAGEGSHSDNRNKHLITR
jgi:hypothetical protein